MKILEAAAMGKAMVSTRVGAEGLDFVNGEEIIIADEPLAFARALGEYCSVVFISGNMPLRTEIAPLLIMTRLEAFDYAGAAAIANVLLVTSFLLLLAIQRLQSWTRSRAGFA